MAYLLVCCHMRKLDNRSTRVTRYAPTTGFLHMMLPRRPVPSGRKQSGSAVDRHHCMAAGGSIRRCIQPCLRLVRPAAFVFRAAHMGVQSSTELFWAVSQEPAPGQPQPAGRLSLRAATSILKHAPLLVQANGLSRTLFVCKRLLFIRHCLDLHLHRPFDSRSSSDQEDLVELIRLLSTSSFGQLPPAVASASPRPTAPDVTSNFSTRLCRTPGSLLFTTIPHLRRH